MTSDKTGDRDIYLYPDSHFATAFKILKIASHYLPQGLPSLGKGDFHFVSLVPFKKALAFISRMI